jgi:hypothetical protein
MCPTRIQPKLLPLEIDLSAAFSFEQGVGRAELLQFGPQLERARQALLDNPSAADNSGWKQPQHILADYHRQRKTSLLGQILAVAKQLRETVDRVVVLGPPRLVAAASSLFTACGHPHHNDLSRGQRGGRPRIYFVPALPDNDALQALLEILPHGRLLQTVDERWGIVALDENIVSPARGEQDPRQLLAGLFSLLWDQLQSTTTAAGEVQLAVAIGPQQSPLVALAEQIGMARIDLAESNSAAHFQAGVLFAGSVIGLDVVKLLHGAQAMAERFATAPVGNNPPLDLAGLWHLLAKRFRDRSCQIEPATTELAPLARQLSGSECSHRQSLLLIQWLPQGSRTDRLSVKIAAGSGSMDRRNCKEQLLTDLAAENAKAVRTARTANGKFTALVKIPLVDEGAVGQLIEMHHLASAVEHLLLFA